MGYTFGMAIETRHGNFLPGQPLPPEWDTRETRRQLVKQFGKDVLNHQGEMAISSMAATLKAIEESLGQIKEALGIRAAPDKAPPSDGAKDKKEKH